MNYGESDDIKFIHFGQMDEEVIQTYACFWYFICGNINLKEVNFGGKVQRPISQQLYSNFF